jgi:hypothetical protein
MFEAWEGRALIPVVQRLFKTHLSSPCAARSSPARTSHCSHHQQAPPKAQTTPQSALLPSLTTPSSPPSCFCVTSLDRLRCASSHLPSTLHIPTRADAALHTATPASRTPELPARDALPSGCFGGPIACAYTTYTWRTWSIALRSQCTAVVPAGSPSLRPHG